LYSRIYAKPSFLHLIIPSDNNKIILIIVYKFIITTLTTRAAANAEVFLPGHLPSHALHGVAPPLLKLCFHFLGKSRAFCDGTRRYGVPAPFSKTRHF